MEDRYMYQRGTDITEEVLMTKRLWWILLAVLIGAILPGAY
jgi:hypothetical protein